MPNKIDTFAADEMSTIARVHFNDGGFPASGRLVKKYVGSAKQKVDDVPHPVHRRDLLRALKKIETDCDYLLWYHSNLQSFRTKQTVWFIQRVSKRIVILLSLWDMSHIHSLISHQLRYFHSSICDILHKTNQKRDAKIVSAPEEKKLYHSTPKHEKVTYNIPQGAFDFSSFLKAISGIESGGKYTADNSKAGEKLSVSASKHAKGKYQFTNETLAHFGYVTVEDRKTFLQSPELQEKLMYKLTKFNYDFALSSPSISKLLDEWVHLSQILASMHHRGSVGTEWVAKYAVKQENPVEAFFQRLETVKWDWLGTKTSSYVKAVSMTYSQIAKVDITQGKSRFPGNAPEETITASITQTPEKTPVKEVPTIASNDERFDNIIVVTQDFTKTEVKETKLPPTTEFQEVASSKPVIEVLREEYKKQVLAKLQSDSTIPAKVRTSLVEKLSNVDNLETYYQEQIDYYNYVLRMSRNDIEKQRAKKILPWLQKLLQDTKTIMASSNDEIIYGKKAA